MKKSVLKSATKDDSTPTSGHVLDEIVAMTTKSLDVCRAVEDWLLGRLSETSPHVLAKTLKVIRYVAEKGHPDFRISMQRKCDPIRTCCNFRGKMDELHGDKLNEEVRSWASRAMDAVFADASSFPQSTNTSLAGRIQGFGSSDMSGSGISSSGSILTSSAFSGGGGGGMDLSREGQLGAGGKVYGGFENPALSKEKPKQNKFMAALSNIGSSVKKIFSKKKNDSYSPTHGGDFFSNRNDSLLTSGGASIGGFQPPPVPVSDSYADQVVISPLSSVLSQPSHSKITSSKSHDTSSSSSRFPHAQVHPTSKQTPLSPPTSSNSNSSSPEQRMIDDIIEVSGVRTLPSREALKNVVHKANHLDPESVVDALAPSLEGSDWKKQARALAITEVLLREYPDAYGSLFAEFYELVQKTASSVQSTLKEKANKVIELLSDFVEVEEEEEEEEEAPAPPPKQSSQNSKNRSRSSSKSTKPQETLTFFDGLTISSESTPSTDMFSDMTVSSSKKDDGWFDFGSSSSAATSALSPPHVSSTTTATAAAPPSAPVSIDDFFGGPTNPAQISSPSPMSQPAPLRNTTEFTASLFGQSGLSGMGGGMSMADPMMPGHMNSMYPSAMSPPGAPPGYMMIPVPMNGFSPSYPNSFYPSPSMGLPGSGPIMSAGGMEGFGGYDAAMPKRRLSQKSSQSPYSQQSTGSDASSFGFISSKSDDSFSFINETIRTK